MRETKPDLLSDDELGDLFAAAKAVPEHDAKDVEPSPALLAAILADAERAQPRPAPAPPRRSVWADLRDAMGGWAGFGGLVAASACGVVIGIGTPDLLGDVSSYFSDAESYLETASGFDLLMEEG